jgi:hypothetical protein
MFENILVINTLSGAVISTSANYHISKLTIYVEEKDCLVCTIRSGDLY